MNGGLHIVPLPCISYFLHSNVVAVTAYQMNPYQYQYKQERYLEDSVTEEFGETDRIIMLIIFMTFAFGIFLFGSLVGYVSILDDSIMRRYKNEGEVVVADVYSVDISRGRNGHGKSCTHRRESVDDGDGSVASKEVEYVAIVTYTQVLSDNYPVRVRKQVRAMESDFFHPECLNNPKFQPTNDCTKTGDEEAAVDQENLIEGSHDHHIQIIENKLSFLRKCSLESSKLNLLVLPGRPKSGYPREQVERAQSIRYRLSTVCLVVSNLLLSLFCIKLAIHLISEIQDERMAHIAWTIFAVFVLLTVLQILLVRLLQHKFILCTLEEEYFESGDFAPIDFDDNSSLSLSFLSLSTSDVNLG